MASSDWEEVRKLAHQFQQAQLSKSSHKLSERNCIEIVNKLVKLGYLDIFYTTDGREYLTPQHLETEIRDEIAVSGGRINLVDLQQILNVDLSHIETKVADILKADRSFTLIQGELIDKDYLNRAAEEINEILQEVGQAAIGDLSKRFGLPADFLLSEIESRLGSQIHGQLDLLDRGMLFTQAFVERNIAKIRGIFSAITRPTQVSSLVSQYGLSEKLFYNVLETLVKEKRISGTIQGRQDKAIYVPEIYTRTQNAWIDSFLRQNGYIEYETLSKLGISDGKQYLKRRYPKGGLLFLQTCSAGKELQEQIDSSIEEALCTGGWIDIKPLLPSPFTDEDATMFLHHCLTGSSRSSLQTFCSGIVTSSQFLDSCKKLFEPLMRSKANKDVQMSPALFSELTKEQKANLTDSKTGDAKGAKREERQKKASQGGGQKGGAGRGVRETKTKKVKDKGKMRGRGTVEEEDEDFTTQTTGNSADSGQLPFLSQAEIVKILSNKWSDCESDFVEELAEYLIRPLQREYQEVAKSVFLSASGNEAVHKRKSHAEYKEKVAGLYSNAIVFNKAIELFPEETQVMLAKHLLKTVCQDLVNVLFNMVASEHLMSLGVGETFTQESRLKLLNKISGEVKGPLTKLNNSLAAKETSDFFEQFDVIAGPQFCDLNVKKLDKKKERQLIFNHRQALTEQLNKELEPAMTLHLTVVLLIYSVSKCIVHAPGRCVPQLIQFLKDKTEVKVHEKLVHYQGLVLRQLVLSGLSEGSTEEQETPEQDTQSCGGQLALGLQDIKDLVKKTNEQEKD